MDKQNNQTSSNYDCVIVGAGIVGGSLALALQKLGLKIALLEKTIPIFNLNMPLQSRSSAITKSSENILTKLGIWQHIQRKHAFTAMHISQANSTQNTNLASDFLELKADEAELDNLGYIIENLAIQDAIFQRLNQANDEIIANTTHSSVSDLSSSASCMPKVIDVYQVHNLDNFEEDICGSKLIFTNIKDQKLILKFKVLFAADGALSKVREMAQFDLEQKPYNQLAIVGCLELTQSHQNKCWQKYRQQGPLAFLAMQDNFASLACYESIDDLEKFKQLIQNKKEFANYLQQESGKQFGEIKTILDLAIFPLVKRKAKNYFKNNIVLVGDAAHSIHPQAGQGINIGLLDVACLLDLIADNIRHDKEIGNRNSLHKYQFLRGVDNRIMQDSMDIFANMFDLQSINLTGNNKEETGMQLNKEKIMNYFLKATNKSTFAKTTLIKQAMFGRLGLKSSLAK